MTTLGYEIRGKDGFYVRRQISSNTLQLVVGHDNVAGGFGSSGLRMRMPTKFTITPDE